MKALARLLLFAASAALVTPALAAVLYKSVDERGVVTFSDVPPPPGADAKRLVMPEGPSGIPGPTRLADAALPEALTEERIRAEDEAVQRASLQVDMAEHALALARRPLWQPVDLMKLDGARLSRADSDRIAYYQKNLRVAKQQLADLLRSKRRAEAHTMTAEAGMPVYGPSSPIYRR